eukprot:COSAG02_NODE_7915_length_2793_cov_5.141797_2_plen_128_part_00
MRHLRTACIMYASCARGRSLRSDPNLRYGPTTEEEAAIKEAKEALKQARLKMAAEEDELLDAEERAEEQARLENEALAAEAKAAGEELKQLMKNANRQDTAKLQVIRSMILRSDSTTIRLHPCALLS